MPESKRRPEAEAKKLAARRAAESERSEATQQIAEPNPAWFVPVMCGLFILGILWIATFYITSGAYPIESIRYWNIGIGMGLLLAGFAMATRWR